MIVEGKQGQILINSQSGLIEQVGMNLGPADLKTDGLIFPGFIDLHVHSRVDVSGKESRKEDLSTVSAAAIHGGVTYFVDMPNNPMPPVDDVSYAAKKALFTRSPVDFTLYAGIGSETKPLPQKVPYKVYMGRSVGELFFESLTQLEGTIKNYSGQFVSFHCEDPEILKAHENEKTHEARRPREAEIKAIALALELIKKFNLQGKICHVSTKEGLELIRQAKKNGVNVTAEVTPHHLYFDENMLNDSNRKFLQVNPPLRTKDDRLALIAGLKSGGIDYLASDHAPHTVEEKQKGISGVPHLDTYGPFITWLMREHNFTAEDIARVCAENPGKFMNNFWTAKLGKIEPGYQGSLTVIEPDNAIMIRKNDLKTKCAWSPFEGVTFPGRVTHTIIAGKVYQV